MKTLTTVIALATIATASAASAESFTTVFKNEPMASATVITVPGPTAALTQVAAHFKGMTTATYRNGDKVVSNYECIEWSTPTAATSAAAVCQAWDNPTDKYSVSIVCGADPDKPAMCWGALVGSSGPLRRQDRQLRPVRHDRYRDRQRRLELASQPRTSAGGARGGSPGAEPCWR